MRFPWEVSIIGCCGSPMNYLELGLPALLILVLCLQRLYSPLHSKQLFSIFNTQPSLLETYFSHCGTIPSIVLLLQLLTCSSSPSHYIKHVMKGWPILVSVYSIHSDWSKMWVFPVRPILHLPGDSSLRCGKQCISLLYGSWIVRGLSFASFFFF